MIKLAPSVLNADFSCLADQIDQVKDGGADYIHLDVMDGHFVPNITIGPMIVEAVNRITDLPLDVHLMIENPDFYLQAFKDAGADIITVHYEAAGHLWRTLENMKMMGLKAGVTLNPATPVHFLDPVLELVDQVLILSVEPGFGGQEFIGRSVDRISYLARRKQQSGYKFDIEVDGGIDIYTLPLAARAGANVFVVGTSIFKSDNIKKTTKEIKDIAIKSYTGMKTA